MSSLNPTQQSEANADATEIKGRLAPHGGHTTKKHGTSTVRNGKTRYYCWRCPNIYGSYHLIKHDATACQKRIDAKFSTQASWNQHKREEQQSQTKKNKKATMSNPTSVKKCSHKYHAGKAEPRQTAENGGVTYMVVVAHTCNKCCHMVNHIKVYNGPFPGSKHKKAAPPQFLKEYREAIQDDHHTGFTQQPPDANSEGADSQDGDQDSSQHNDSNEEDDE
jgi:hypothetical protein